jgi:nicotinate-nucleotide adenylyltransferase
MKVGLYFGTFNPIHIGHLIIANHMAEYSDLDQVWMVVTPHNPFKKKSSLLDDYHRLHMVRLAIEDCPKLRASDIEFKLEQPNYTVNTLAHLQEKYPGYEFSLIMGTDNLQSLHKWKNFEVILENHDIYVYPRITHDGEEMAPESGTIRMIDAPVIEISSTFIRQAIRDNKNVMPMLPYKVWQYLDSNIFYRK